MTPQPIADDIRNAHDRVADTYGLAHVDGSLDKNSYDAWNLHRNVIVPLTEIVRSRFRNSFIIDAGCGNGQIAEILQSVGGGIIIGVDFSEEMLHHASLRIQRAGLTSQVHLLQAELDRLDMIRSSVFDGGIMFGVLEHLDNPSRVIANILRTIKPGGTFVLGVPRKGSLSYLTYVLFGESPRRWGTRTSWWDRLRFREKLHYYRFFSVRAIREILSESPKHRLVKRIPFAHAHMDGTPGFFLRWLGRKGPRGRRILDAIESVCRCLHCIPAGEYLLLERASDVYSPDPGKSPGSSSSS